MGTEQMTKTEQAVDRATREFENSPEFKNELKRRNFANLIKQTALSANAAYISTVITGKERK